MSDNNNTPSFLPSPEEIAADEFYGTMSDLVQDPAEDQDASRINVLCMSLISGKVIFGINLDEFDDSYLVGLPAFLYQDDKGIRGRSLAPASIIRLFKSNINFVSKVEPMHRQYYYEYLHRRMGKLRYYFNEERVVTLMEALTRPKLSAIKFEEEDSESISEPWKYLPYNTKTRH